ncbi:hypothetical protein [Nakamurella multipartita]|uniref:Leucine-binding protein domain-containing protein n=1 Tax=Nakamurella multipartita (strain ATCC 700099 / DSM 44233 / CIP 104796 / JCM 9543 / NBRC 105858 / Y-104) TaxID=479431 RepID=C8X8Z6_NAKMY|nr:hypothetical protein [Nakamurella multipartita]ACV81094.1 hypothetical protein Namu_4819 [Nakamurella multipartita DSM 44233]
MLPAALLAGACTSVLDRSALPSGDPRTGGSAVVTASAPITPVTPDGLIAGPGVSDSEIALGILADPGTDRGFTAGVHLWQRSVNTSGGVCGRTVTTAGQGSDDISADAATAYRQIGPSTLGLLAPTPPAGGTLTASIAADQIPLVTATATSTQLNPSGPLVAGATADILIINGLDHLRAAGVIDRGATVGVLDDGSGLAANALAGARWWAAQNEVTLDVRPAGGAAVDGGAPDGGPGDDGEGDGGEGDGGAAPDEAGWTGVAAVLVPADPAAVSALLAGSTLPVLTLLDGFEPGDWTAATVDAADGRLFVATPAPAYGSDYPAAVTVASVAAAAGTDEAGPRTLDGYAAGSTWGRLITQACADRTLTRAGIRQAASTVGAAPAGSLFGPGELSLVVGSGLPATRVSSISVAQRTAPTGLRSLTWLESAPGIEDYLP